MVKLILTGGGDAPDSKPLDELFISYLPKKKILYIPIAWKSGDFDECKSWFTSTFGNLGFSDFEMWTEINDKSFEDLEHFGGIYIGGGNTFSLLNELRDSKFDNLLMRFLESGRPIYGGSAGAIIFGNSIEIAGKGIDSDSNDVGLKNFSGFNMVNNYSIQCHYEFDQDDELIKFSKQGAIIALSEKSGIFVEDSKIKVVGFEPAYVFNEGKKTEYQVGSEIK
jgi:dipeptidase E